MLCIACSVNLLQANRIVVLSLQHVARSFKGFTGNAATEHLSRRGDLHTLLAKRRDFNAWQVSVSTKIAAFSWTVAQLDVLQVRHRRSSRYGEQRTIFIPVRRRPTTSLGPAIPVRRRPTTSLTPATPARRVPPVPCPCSTIRIIYVSCTSDRSTHVQYIRML